MAPAVIQYAQFTGKQPVRRHTKPYNLISDRVLIIVLYSPKSLSNDRSLLISHDNYYKTPLKT